MLSYVKPGDTVWSTVWGWCDVVWVSKTKNNFVMSHPGGKEEVYFTGKTDPRHINPTVFPQSISASALALTMPSEPPPVRFKNTNGFAVPDIGFVPTAGERYYLADPSARHFHSATTHTDSAFDRRVAERGFAYPDSEAGKEAASAHGKAMLGKGNLFSEEQK